MTTATFKMSNGFKAYVSRERNKVEASAPKRKDCPKCERSREIGFFGVRTHKGADGKPNRFSLQSYCVDCRAGKVEKSKPAAKPSKAASAPKVTPQVPALAGMTPLGMVEVKPMATAPKALEAAPVVKPKGKRKLQIVDVTA